MKHEEYDIYTRVTRLETQMSRIVSDIESEKRTRSNVNNDVESRLRKVEKSIYIAMGIYMVCSFLVSVLIHHYLK